MTNGLDGNENGRDEFGRFAKGWKGGPGGDTRTAVVQFREALRMAVTPDDVVAVIRRLHEKALEGDVGAAREFLDRCLGKATPPAMPEIHDGERVPIRITFEPRTTD